MSNDYFTHDIELQPGTKARAEDVNDRFNGIVTGFDHLPDPHLLKQGFGAPVPMSDGTAFDEGATVGQVVGSTLSYSADTGSPNAYVVTLDVAPTAYANGVRVLFRAANTNTGASTINVNGLGIKTLSTYSGAALLASDILAGALVEAIYDDGKFKITSHFNQYDGSAETYALNAAASADAAESYRDETRDYRNETIINHATFLKFQW